MAPPKIIVINVFNDIAKLSYRGFLKFPMLFPSCPIIVHKVPNETPKMCKITF
jgi:hypothetical protein